MSCDFITQLSKLRKLSAESVENTDRFDPYKEYLHVERQVELQLRELLRSINANQHKSLVLLCGSAGDGKSHLISYLKNQDSENLLEDFEPYNDATESSEPTLTSIDTLADKLGAFDDEHCDLQDGKKMIMAINLGTLNNFIESEKGKRFSRLREYVETHGILSGFAKEPEYQEGSVFQHVSFSDYQIFSLDQNGIKTEFLEKVLEKIFAPKDENRFYKAYMADCTCPLCNRCPVHHNYEFLSDPIHQKAVIDRIAETVLKDKTIVSTRDVLNLIYDLIVHPDFNKSKIGAGVSDVEYLTNYISWTTPMLLNEYEDISPLLNNIRSHDILKMRSAYIDEDVTRFHALECIDDIFQKAAGSTPYWILHNISNISQLGIIKPDLKRHLYKFIVRLLDMSDQSTRKQYQIRYGQYINYLYYQNSGNEQKLGALYEATKNAVMNWDGSFASDTICIDDTNEHFWILEQLQLRASIDKSAAKISGELKRFSPVLKLRFKSALQSELPSVEISVDYSLFELISDMKEGYRPTVNDKNRHANFVSFVQRLIEFGNKANRIVLIPKNCDNRDELIFEETDFGYKFGVMK